MSRPRAIFMGTPDIAVPALEALTDVADVVGVVCQPDRPAGRGLALKAPPVKVWAEAHGLEVHQPTKLRSGAFPAWMKAQRADVALVIAYGRILPQDLLDAPKKGCMNLHASLLPAWRGAAPINWSVAGGDTETGITLMQMDAGMDTGPMLSRHSLPIGPDETAGELYVRLGALAADVVRQDLVRAVRGELSPIVQDHDAATMAPMMTREDGRVNWTLPAKRVHDHVRGMTPWPGAHTTLSGKRFKVLRTRRLDDAPEGAPGTVVRCAKDHVAVACGEGAIGIVRGQLAGKKALDAGPLVAGRSLAEGMVLGADDAATPAGS